MNKLDLNLKLDDDQKILDEMYQKYLSCPEAIDYMKKNNIDDDTVKKYIVRVNDFVDDLIYCKNCKGANLCQKDNPLTIRNIVYRNGVISLNLTPCRVLEEKFKIENKFYIKDIPSDYLNCTLKSVDFNSLRYPLMQQFSNFLNKNDSQWIYIEGVLGTGKTFLVSAFINQISQTKDMTISFLNCSIRFKELNDLSYQDKEEFNRLMDNICNCDILVLDDFGNEYKNDFIRDGILFNIISRRLSNKKLTIFTSEFTINEIEKLYSFTKAGEIRSKQLTNMIRRGCQKEFNLGDLSIY